MAVNDNQTQYMLRHCLSIQTDQIHHHSCQKTCILYQFYLAGHSHLPHLITVVKFKCSFYNFAFNQSRSSSIEECLEKRVKRA